MEKENVIIAPVGASNEVALSKEVSAIESHALGVNVQTDVDYQVAAQWLTHIKGQQKKVTEFFEPMRKAAKETYDKILGRKKEMLSPLERAERILKEKMGAYTEAQEQLRKEREAEMRRIAMEAVDQKIDEAADAESCGDLAAADFALTDAEILEGVANSGSLQKATPKAKGISHTKAWKITGIDKSAVPIEFSGVEIRPIDERAIMQIIKASKGTAQIPGVKYEETVTISVRS